MDARFYELIEKIERNLTTEDTEVVEDSNSYSFYNSILPIGLLTNITKSHLSDFFNYFEDSARISLASSSQGTTVYTKDKGIDFIIGDIEDIISIETEVGITININKDKLIRKIIPSINLFNEYYIKMFSCEQNFKDYLKNSTVNFVEKTLFKPSIRTIIIISNLEGIYKNDYLTLSGEHLLVDLLPILSSSNNTNLFGKSMNIIDMRNKVIRQEHKTHFITPDYLYLPNIDIESLKQPLLLKCSDCIVTFLADSIKVVDDKYLCQFNGYRNSNIELNEELPKEYTSKVNRLFDLYEWAYESSFEDKLVICRKVISKYLKDNSKLNYKELLTNIEEIIEVSKYNYSTFFEDKIDSFFEDRKKIAEYTYQKVTAIESAINNLTDTMSKNIITAIGIILAAIVTYTTGKKLTLPAIKIAILAYIIFMGVSVVYNLIPPLISIKQLRYSNSHLIKYYTAFLPEEEIDRIQGNILKNKFIYFWIYWWITFGAITLLLIVSIYIYNHLTIVLSTFVS